MTTFAGGWVVLPAPINWNYVFANMDFMRNKTIYLTMIIIAILYILIMIYARHKDKKDVEKVNRFSFSILFEQINQIEFSSVLHHYRTIYSMISITIKLLFSLVYEKMLEQHRK